MSHQGKRSQSITPSIYGPVNYSDMAKLNLSQAQLKCFSHFPPVLVNVELAPQ